MENVRKKKSFKLPHPVILLSIVILIMTICTYIIPAGQYDRIPDPVSGKKVVDPASYKTIEQAPVGVMEMFSSIPRGLAAGQEIIFFIIIVAGSFQIITATGAIEGGVGSIATALRNKDHLMIPIIMAVFSIGGATFGMAEENIIFVPIGIALARALGYDALVGMAMITLGAACGFCAGMVNPFTTGIAQQIAELPMYSGIGFRFVVWAVMLAITSTYVIRYGRKVKKNAANSIVRDLEIEEAGSHIDLDNVAKLTGRQKLVLLAIVAAFAFLVYGVFKKGFSMTEIGTIFLMLGIASAIIGGLGVDRSIKEFFDGAKGMVSGAIMVGIARAILVVMQDGQIIDTIIYNFASVLVGLPKAVTALGMFLIEAVLDFINPSATGKAAATMPIMIPLADVVGITRQLTVLIYQFGDGFASYIEPTSGTLIATLAVAKISYEKWVKFMFPIWVIWMIMGGGFVLIADLINYGPF